jgi:hypothetical protein
MNPQIRFAIFSLLAITVLAACVRTSSIRVIVHSNIANVDLRARHLSAEDLLLRFGFISVSPTKSGKPDTDSVRVEDERGLTTYFTDPKSPDDATGWDVILRSNRKSGDLGIDIFQIGSKPSDAMMFRAHEILLLVRTVVPEAKLDKAR